MGGVTLGGPGRGRAAAVHNEIYGALRERTTAGMKKILSGRAALMGYGSAGMGSHADWGYPEREGYSGRGMGVSRYSRVICDM